MLGGSYSRPDLLPIARPPPVEQRPSQPAPIPTEAEDWFAAVITGEHPKKGAVRKPAPFAVVVRRAGSGRPTRPPGALADRPDRATVDRALLPGAGPPAEERR